MNVITIGRDESNDKVITDPCTSRHHLQIIQHDDGHFTLSDFGSTNGTFVNGQKISGEIPLNDMDIVRIGNTTIPWRMYFDDVENDAVKGIQDSEQERERRLTSDRKKTNGKTTFKAIHIVCLAFFALYTAFALIIMLFNSDNEDIIFPCIGSICGAIILIFGILKKIELDKQPVATTKPNGQHPESLISFFHIGTTFVSSFKFRRIDDTFVSYTFFRIIIPLLPTGCYRVKGNGTNEWYFYGSEEKKTSEIVCIYLIYYGLIIWLTAAIFLLFINLL